MIINHEYKFIFIKTRKVAGTSVEFFLSQLCKPGDIVTPIFPKIDGHISRYQKFGPFFNHVRGSDVKLMIDPDIWNSYVKFTIERNPWDKTLSQYNWVTKHRKNFSLQSFFKRFPPCYNYTHYTDSNGEIIVDKICKFETLMSDLQSVFDHLGIPFNGDLGIKAKKSNNKRTYREVFNNEQRQMIAESFVREIELHGYEW